MTTNRRTTALAAGLAVATLAAGTSMVTAGAVPSAPAAGTTTVTTWRADEVTAVVRFANRSAKLRKKANRVLDATAATVPEGSRKVRGRVIGWVQKGGSHELSVRRAKKVRSALVGRGVDGRWVAKGKGVDGPTRESRKATIRIRFRAPITVTVPLPATPPARTVTATETATATETQLSTVTATTTATQTTTIPVPTTTTATATSTVTATQTTTIPVPTTTTATATATVTETVTTSPPAALTPLNEELPHVSFSWGEDVTLLAGTGGWAGGDREPLSYSVQWQTGDYYGWSDDGPVCAGFSNHPTWSGWEVTTTWDQVPECFRVVVTATNAAGSTVAYGPNQSMPV